MRWITCEQMREIVAQCETSGIPYKTLPGMWELIDGREIIIETLKDRRGKYGRYLAEIWIGQEGVWLNVNDALVATGHAVYQEY